MFIWDDGWDDLNYALAKGTVPELEYIVHYISKFISHRKYQNKMKIILYWNDSSLSCS